MRTKKRLMSIMHVDALVMRLHEAKLVIPINCNIDIIFLVTYALQSFKAETFTMLLERNSKVLVQSII